MHLLRMMTFKGGGGGVMTLVMCLRNDFISFERFYVWFVKYNIIPGQLGFARY